MNPRLIRAFAHKHGIGIAEAESEIIRTVREVASGIAPRFRFGYHTPEDIEQQAVLFALKVLRAEPAKYDVNRPLANFLYTHVRNQLSNMMRKQFLRTEPACSCCDPFNPPAKPCQKWIDWDARNRAKQNIMRPLDVSGVNDEGERRMSSPSATEDDVLINELEQLINTRLPVSLRADYRRMRDHVVIPKPRRQRVREFVASIAREAGYIEEEEGDGC